MKSVQHFELRTLIVRAMGVLGCERDVSIPRTPLTLKDASIESDALHNSATKLRGRRFGYCEDAGLRSECFVAKTSYKNIKRTVYSQL